MYQYDYFFSICSVFVNCHYITSTTSDLPNFSLTSIPLPATTQNGRVARLVVTLFRFPKIIPKCLTFNPLSQIATSNPRLQPNTHFAVDMFPYKKTELFQKSGFKSKPPKSPETRRFLALIYLSLTSILPSPHGSIRPD